MCHYFSTIKCGHRLQSKQYFGMKQAAYHRLITVFDNLFEVLHREAQVPEATYIVLTADSSKQKKRRYVSSWTQAAGRHRKNKVMEH